MDFNILFEDLALEESIAIPPDFDINRCIPTEADFNKIAGRFKDYRENGNEADWISTPWGMVRSAKDIHKQIKYIIVALLINYDELAEAYKKELIAKYNKEEIKAVFDKLKPFILKVAPMADKYRVTESLKEASTLTPLEKMKAFNDGTRRENVKACSDQKIVEYYKIAGYHRLNNARDQLFAEIKRRGLVNEILSFGGTDFNREKAKHIRSLLEHDPSALFIDYLDAYDQLKSIFVTLIFVICFDDNEVAAELVKIIADKFLDTKEAVKEVINRCLSNSWLVKHITESVNAALTECLTESTIIKRLESLDDESISEDIEKHEELNPKLWTANNELRPEVQDKILTIVKTFVDDLQKDQINIDVDDIILVGSNANYNYTKDSDLDIHIIANTKTLEYPEYLYNAVYSAYRSLFNKKFDIDFYGIPVEIYVETEGIPRVSGGCFSVLKNTWLRTPIYADIPEYDETELNNQVYELERACIALIHSINITADQVEQFIENVYSLRKEGLASGSEWNLQNLVFKEFRNRGYLDQLKELKNKLKSRELSLEDIQNTYVDTWNKVEAESDDDKEAAKVLSSAKEALDTSLSDKDIYEYRIKIQQLTHHPAIIHANRTFELTNIDENEAQTIIRKLQQAELVDWVQKTQTGYNFNQFNFSQGARPHHYFKIYGQLTVK